MAIADEDRAQSVINDDDRFRFEREIRKRRFADLLDREDFAFKTDSRVHRDNLGSAILSDHSDGIGKKNYQTAGEKLPIAHYPSTGGGYFSTDTRTGVISMIRRVMEVRSRRGIAIEDIEGIPFAHQFAPQGLSDSVNPVLFLPSAIIVQS